MKRALARVTPVLAQCLFFAEGARAHLISCTAGVLAGAFHLRAAFQRIFVAGSKQGLARISHQTLTPQAPKLRGESSSAQGVSPGILRRFSAKPRRGERKQFVSYGHLSPFQGFRPFGLAHPGLTPWAMVISRLRRSGWVESRTGAGADE